MIQGLRANAELGITDAVNKANEAMGQMATLNQQIAASGSAGSARRLYRSTVAIDGHQCPAGRQNQVNIFTNLGIQLVGTQAAQLTFDAVGTMTPASQWNANPALRGVGTITLIPPAGTPIDLIQARAIRSGTIAAFLEMRDDDLAQAQAQAQVDALARAWHRRYRTRRPQAALPRRAANRVRRRIGSLLAGNSVTINYTDSSAVSHTITLLRVDDPAALPLSDTVTANPNDTVFGIDFSGDMAAIITQINTALTAR